MCSLALAVLCIIFGKARLISTSDLSFPPWFKFGVGTSAYQIEGGWNVSDKGESIWDHLTHTNPNAIRDGSNGDVACDSYHHWSRDIDMLSDLGVQFYRFSISWPRLLPSGFPNHISEDGKKYYSNLIDRLLAKGIQPIVTLYHFDLPLNLQELGGWTNPYISDWFASYARVVYYLYADRVKTWLTINEPISVCDIGYGSMPMLAPLIKQPKIGSFLCSKHVLLAHAKAWKIYDEEFKPKYHGQASIVNNLFWLTPATPADEDLTELVRRHFEIYTHPVYSKSGGWSPDLERVIAENSQKEGHSRSRLPTFTPEEIDLIKGTYDFYALNYYTSRLVRKAEDHEVIGAWPLFGAPEFGAVLEGDPNWNRAHEWIMLYPKGFRKQMLWLKKNYGNLNVLITENGFPSTKKGLEDYDRLEAMRDFLEQVLISIKEDGINVTGYTAWALMDNFEWMDGYSTKFGLYETDFDHAELKCTPRKSAQFYKKVIETHSLEVKIQDIKDEL